MRFSKPFLIFFVLSPIFVFVQGCSSPPQLAKVEHGKKQPVNNQEWVQERQARFNQDVATRAMQANQGRAPDASFTPPAKQFNDARSQESQPEQQPQLTTEHFMIPFAQSRSPLTPIGKVTLDKIVSQLNDGLIQIVGRPDAIIYKQGKLAAIPQNRANNIRDYLVQKGVPSKAISISIDTSPNRLVDSIYPSDVYLTHRQVEPPRAQPFQPEKPAMAVIPPAVHSEPLVDRRDPAAVSENKAQASLIKWVLRLAQTKQLSSEEAARIISDLAGDSMPAEVSEVQPIRQKTAAPVAPAVLPAKLAAEEKPVVAAPPAEVIKPVPPPATLFVAATATVRKPLWVLDTGKTLKENLDAWAKQAGWNPPEWLASNFFQVTNASTLEGVFINVLGQISDATKLNICITQREKRLKVIDSNISCKN